MNIPGRHLVIGLPGAGKTTFIAALRHITEAGDVPGALRLASLGDDDRFINGIRGSWVQCQPLARTMPEHERLVCVRLSTADGAHTADLEFPDLSGELIEHQWSLRLCPESHAESVQTSAGVMLFIHPRSIVPPTAIADADVAVAALVGEDASEAEDQESKGREYNARDAAVQVKLVELLQFIVELRGSQEPLPVAIMISAWDKVATSQAGAAPITPVGWLRDSMPLLFQFLSTNSDMFLWRPFGVSAQGGDIDKDHDRLLGMPPSERLRLLEDTTESRDITIPIQWLATCRGVAL